MLCLFVASVIPVKITYHQKTDSDIDADGASDCDVYFLDAVSSCGVCFPSEEEAGAAR